MSLFYAASKADETYRVVFAQVENGGVTYALSNQPMTWENAAYEDWDYLDNVSDGAFFRDFRLIECPEGTPLTNAGPDVLN